MKRKLGETFVATRVQPHVEFPCRKKLGTSHLLNHRLDRSSKGRFHGSDLIKINGNKTSLKLENLVILLMFVYGCTFVFEC